MPLRIEIFGTAYPDSGKRLFMWPGDDSIALGPDTTHAEFLGVLERKLGSTLR